MLLYSNYAANGLMNCVGSAVDSVHELLSVLIKYKGSAAGYTNRLFAYQSFAADQAASRVPGCRLVDAEPALSANTDSTSGAISSLCKVTM